MRPRIVIVGGGIAGLSTAWHLAHLGATDIVLIEREPALGTQATSQNAAILRTATDDPALFALASRSARFLADPPAGFDRPLLERCGMVLVTPPESPAPECFGPPAEPLTADRVRALAPSLTRSRGTAWWLAGEGRVNLTALIAGFERGTRSAGVRHVLGQTVRRLLPDGRGVELQGGTHVDADHTVLAAGAWAAPLARAAGSRVDLTPTRRHLLVTQRDERIDPRGPILWSEVDDIYVRPDSGGLMVCPCDEEQVDPDTLAASTTMLALSKTKCAAAFDAFEPRKPARFWAGLRTHAPDQRFVIGRDPDVAGLVWAAGLGGNGITCCAAVGELAAAAVLDRAMPSELVEPFSPARFSAAPAHRS